ncbi:right-handed parallel beta-helix repeat-containing protein [Alteromonas sp. 1_MG-2023]|uniref:right-handed parallel beta-helix repeat-containing protein n=1 Tax=Alteromonas sp. 1_MG-2023 TaxID=3062669 RepID=UPI0026E2E324|nr:right-handed parallel beta-helix repeat-containing protein [Alteromonas sp. 1_MG-2023]MDO6473977.1 right-handed parallel beta-helix repeat-containing protein [Alteromonas sp. 1_MG-2023]
MCRILTLCFLTGFVLSARAGADEPLPEQLTITPLIESAGIELPGQSAGGDNTLRFREAGTTQWQDANPLYFDPVNGSLSGAVVYLKPSSHYDIELSVTDDAGTRLYTDSFYTGADKPPVDPQKIYHLKDIYQGGTLDVEALGIEGAQGAWAMIKGDLNTPIVAPEDALSAIRIGAQSYVYFEDITIAQGGQLGFFAEEAHHIWVNGCDISQWGRRPAEYRKGIAYDDRGRQINYDSAFFMRRSGVITVENCYVHDPVFGANHWGNGHPKGTNAFLAFANHPEEAFQGQIILRNNTFTGTDEVRFNDVVESRFNLNSDGGFIRDSAVYNNTFAYANDDIIELDGGQHNVLVYNNDFSHGYGGISVAPVRRGPSYIFHNTVHSMGDERGMMWAAIKAGGVSSNPEGQVNLFNNYVYSSGNGITASYVQGDDGFWVNAVNNVIITGPATDVSGFSILDKQFDARSLFTGNYLFNLDTASERFQADITVPFADSTKLNTAFAQSLAEQAAPKTMNIADGLTVANFSKFAGGLITGKTRPVTGAAPYLSFSHVLLEEMLNFNKFAPASYDAKQDDTVNGGMTISDDGSTLTLSGNAWKQIAGQFTVDAGSRLVATVKIEGPAEIAALGLDTNLKQGPGVILSFGGSQSYGHLVNDLGEQDGWQRLVIPVGQYLKAGNYQYLTFILDNDATPQAGKIHFRHIALIQGGDEI